MKWFLLSFTFLSVLLLCDSAWAWGPATHLVYGMNVMSQLSRLSEPLRELISSQSLAFLYGTVSADIVLAKKLGSAMTHCHNWKSGIELIENAPTPRVKAFAYGYASHLAADTISHNCYVPSKTIESYDSGVLRHVYWELLFDKRLTTSKVLRLFEEIAKGDFNDCDQHLEGLIPMRIFDFSLNKQIFNQLLILQAQYRWQKLWNHLSQSAPWPLEDREVRAFTERSMDAVMSFLIQYRDSEYLNADPKGEERLRSANELRKFYKKTLITDSPASRAIVRGAVDRFAREPFQAIPIEQLAVSL